ncbi:MAG: hypothetical protein HQK75_14060 [Candidatus Magnetomorum sp.]|nr:hypothetical protein [Candidatus Magnetomorum sp.]
MFYQYVFFRLFIVFYTIVITGSFVFAVETDRQINLNVIDRLARIEEGQKAIISEMKARFEASDKRFESILREMNQRFEAVDQRFEAVDKRFEAVDKRFESLLREMSQRFDSVDKRFDSVDKRIDSLDKRIDSLDKRINSLDKRIDSLDKRIDQLGTYIIAMVGTFITLFLAIIGYAIWDRKTLLAKSLEKSQEITEQLFYEHKQQYHISPLNSHEKLDQMLSIMKKMSDRFPEMRDMMYAAQLL